MVALFCSYKCCPCGCSLWLLLVPSWLLLVIAPCGRRRHKDMIDAEVDSKQLPVMLAETVDIAKKINMVLILLEASALNVCSKRV